MSGQLLTRSRFLASAMAVGLALAGCGGGDSGDDERQALADTGLSDTEIDCILETAEVTPEELLAVDGSDGSDATEAVLDAFDACVDAEGAEPEGEDTTPEEPVADEPIEPVEGPDDDALRAQIIANGLTEAEVDCILEDTEFSLDDLLELEALLGTIDEDEPTNEQVALLDCFGAGEDPDAEDISSATFDGDCSLVDGPCSYGDDPDLDALWDACAVGDGAACDQLFLDSPVGSEYEHYGNTCGERGFEESCAAVYRR